MQYVLKAKLDVKKKSMNKISKVLALGMRMCYNHLFGRAIKELWPTVLHCYTVLTLFFCFQQLVSEPGCHLLLLPHCQVSWKLFLTCCLLKLALSSLQLHGHLSDHSLIFRVPPLSCKGHSGSLKNLLF